MIRATLETFITTVADEGEITLADVRCLHRDILPDGIESRDEADLLIALDRAVGRTHSTWNAFVIQAVVDFVVWTSRPTGYVDHETATWLVASLTAGRGPTPVAEAIAFEIVREAERTDPALLAFVMRAAGGRVAVSRTDLAA